MRIADETIEQIRQQADIVEVVGSYVDLKPAGKLYKARCPFHQEKTPSFFVTPEKGTYKCFGCGVSGDVFSFIEGMEHLSFLEAVRFLAERYHVPLESADPEEAKRRALRVRDAEINAAAAKFFYRNLLHNKRAQTYLYRRGLKGESVNAFYLGYADGSGSSLYQHLTKQGYHAEDLLRLGLIARSNRGSGYYDKFRDRLMFPIISLQDRIIGFGGRAIGDRNPKYLNSPDSEVFHKGEHLYHLNAARKVQKRERLILVEGYMDVVSLDYHGVHEAVASLGTSLTEKQAALIKRYAPKVYICYDGDSAGIRAARRAVSLLEGVGLTPKLVVLPDGKDPDDVARLEGAEAFYGYLDAAMDPLDFELRLLRVGYNLETPAGRLDFLPPAIDFLADIPHAAKRAVMAQEVARLSGVEVESVESDLAMRLKEREREHNRERPRTTPSSQAEPTWEGIPEPYEEGDPYEDWTPHDGGVESNASEWGIQKKQKLAVERYRLELELVRFLLADAAWEGRLGECANTFIQDEGLKEAIRTMRALREAGLPPKEELFDSVHLSQAARDALATIWREGEVPEGEMAHSLLLRVQNFRLREEKERIEQEITASSASDVHRREALLQELVEVERRLRAGRGGLDERDK